MELEKGRSAGNSANDKTSAREKLLKGWTTRGRTNMQTPVGLFNLGSHLMEELAEEFAGLPRPFHPSRDSRDRDRLSRYPITARRGVIVAER